MSDTFKKFWIVWNPNKTNNPQVKHYTYEEALLEAKRISAVEPGGNVIYILQAVSLEEKRLSVNLISMEAA